jgi:hypothetical protein
MPAMMQTRTVDPDERPIQERSFETALTEALLKEYPVASVVDKVDDKFVQLLETMAALDLDGSLNNQPVQILKDISHVPGSVLTDLGCPQADGLSRAA